MAKMFNAILEGLNSKEKLPRYVLVMLDKDLIQNLNYFDYGEYNMFTMCLKWLVKNIGRVFEERREDLRWKKPGSLSNATEPRIIWLTMITRPIIMGDEIFGKIFSAKAKFNKVLEAVLFENKYNHIMFVDNVYEKHHFDKYGELTNAGKSEMWLEINHEMRLFDQQILNLKPRCDEDQAHVLSNLRQKLPTPKKRF